MSGLTSAQIHKLNRDPVADPHVLLIEIEEEHGGTVLRYAADNQDGVSNGETYSAASFEYQFPGSGDAHDKITISVSNVNRAPGRALINSQERITVRMMIVDVSEPDDVLLDTLDIFVITDAYIGPDVVQANLQSVLEWRSPVPFYRATKDLFPGCWV